MERGDARLCLVLTELATGDGGLEDGDALDDQVGVPLAAVLFRQRHDASVWSGSVTPTGVMEQHEFEQAVDLGKIHQCGQLSREADRLGGEIDVARVALVEDEVEDADRRGRIALVIESGAADGALGPADALDMVLSGTK